jgi:hypothetical protein
MAELERVSGNIAEHLVVDCGSYQVYRSDFEDAISRACEELKIDDLKTEGQRPWKAVCKRVGEILFPDTSVLKDRKLYNNNNSVIPETNNNRYDYELINSICDEYIYFSNIYNKLCSILAFSYIINIPDTTISLWSGHSPSSTSFNVWKKLQGTRRDCITDKAYDANSPVGAMFVGNNEFAMNQPGVGYEATQARALTANELPQLGGTNSQNIKALSNDNVVDNAK